MEVTKSLAFLLCFLLMVMSVVMSCDEWESGASDEHVGTDLNICSFTQLVEEGFDQFIRNDTDILRMHEVGLQDHHWNGSVVKERVDSLQGIDLMGNQLTVVPKVEYFAETLKLLRLDYNKITSLDLNYFEQFSHLERVSFISNLLANDNITPVDANREITIHESFSLADNKFRTIDLNIFNRCHIGGIGMSLNPVTSIEPSDEISTSVLGYLSVTGIDITEFPNLTQSDNLLRLQLKQVSIPVVDMNYLKHLTGVYIDESPLDTLIESNNVLYRLRDLSLTNCALSGEFPLEHLNSYHLPALRIVTLSHNRFNSFVAPTTEDIVAATELDLDNNSFEELDLEVFSQYVPGIRILDFSYNSLKLVHPFADTTSLPQLVSLDLSHNALLALPDLCSVSSLQTPQIVVTGNPLFCDGCIAWINSCPAVDYVDAICTEPQSLVGVNALSLTGPYFQQCIQPALTANDTKSHTFVGGNQVSQPPTDAAIIFSPVISEIDCARKTIHVGGPSFTFDTNTRACHIYTSFVGSYDVIFRE